VPGKGEERQQFRQVTFQSPHPGSVLPEPARSEPPKRRFRLGAGATCTMTVTFNPTINGTIKGAVAIANSTAVNPQIYNVSGAAVLPLTFSPASLTFAAQLVGSTSAAKTVTLTNNASTGMSSIGFVASGDYAAFATGGTPCGASLGAHAKCTIGVTFTPSATGAIKGSVTVTYSGVAPSFSPQGMSLTGTGK
jgi:hypothetical protein